MRGKWGWITGPDGVGDGDARRLHRWETAFESRAGVGRYEAVREP